MFPPVIFKGETMEIFVDFDNTLIIHSDDLDQPHNKEKGLQWYLNIVDHIEFKLSLAGLYLAEWLVERDFTVLTARGEHNNDVTNVLFDIFGYVPSIIYCSGGDVKRKFLANLDYPFFLIDNNPEYNPDYLFTENFRVDDLNRCYMKKCREALFQYMAVKYN